MKTKRKAAQINAEKITLVLMLRMYCRYHHNRDQLCRDCSDLLEYALCRLENCRYGNDKPACSHCPVHCYKPEMRDAIKRVMRFSGPRMMVRHPLLVVRHLWISFMSPSKLRKIETT